MTAPPCPLRRAQPVPLWSVASPCQPPPPSLPLQHHSAYAAVHRASHQAISSPGISSRLASSAIQKIPQPDQTDTSPACLPAPSCQPCPALPRVRKSPCYWPPSPARQSAPKLRNSSPAQRLEVSSLINNPWPFVLASRLGPAE
ncbi:uncharacterized protein BKA78DRAFT_366517 [Phyllosticta capitalensis]|uniref:uncharacterized protein n=1 Tax=Phyllosticta capitalensis TaxID=121624 RepID=UPI00312DF4BC